ncbi:MAG: YeeE/YedE family protein [Nitrospirae bacterium]|nr:YeeE/YedE family protein [Nitrospirota bacterium]
MTKNNFWSPYIAGTGLGLTLLATFYIAGWGLGASGAFSLLTSVGMNQVLPDFTRGLSYFSQYLNAASPLKNWMLFEIFGVFLGALSGALFSRNFRFRFIRGSTTGIGMRLFAAVTGGILIGFAGRLARGCTSGVALSGGAQLAMAGWIFVIAMFVGGFIAAAFLRRLWS